MHHSRFVAVMDCVSPGWVTRRLIGNAGEGCEVSRVSPLVVSVDYS